MKIEIGNRYNVSNMFKKSFIEVNEITAENEKTILRTIVWRSGDIIVIPMDDDEVEYLQTAVDAGESFDDIFEFDAFMEWEFDNTWDGCSEDYESLDQEKLDALMAEYEALEDDDYFDFVSWLEEEKGYDYSDTIYSIEGPIDVTEVS